MPIKLFPLLEGPRVMLQLGRAKMAIFYIDYGQINQFWWLICLRSDIQCFPEHFTFLKNKHFETKSYGCCKIQEYTYTQLI